MNPFASRLQRCAVAAALGTALLGAATPGLANDQLAEFSLDGSTATWMPKENLRYSHLVLTLVASPENERICCDGPVGPEGVSVDLSAMGEGAYKYELYMVPVRRGMSTPATGQGAGSDENGRPIGAAVAQAATPSTRRGPVQSGYFTYGVEDTAEE